LEGGKGKKKRGIKSPSRALTEGEEGSIKKDEKGEKGKEGKGKRELYIILSEKKNMPVYKFPVHRKKRPKGNKKEREGEAVLLLWSKERREVVGLLPREGRSQKEA